MPLLLRAPHEIAVLWRSPRPRVPGIALLSPLGSVLILLALQRGAAAFAAGVIALASS